MSTRPLPKKAEIRPGGRKTACRAAKRPPTENQSYTELPQDMGDLQRGQHENVVFLVSSHDGNKKFGRFPKKKKWISGQKLHFWPQNMHLAHKVKIQKTLFLKKPS